MGSLLAIPVTQALNQALGGATMGTALTYSYSMPGLWLCHEKSGPDEFGGLRATRDNVLP
jgi:hypothetical protein